MAEDSNHEDNDCSDFPKTKSKPKLCCGQYQLTHERPLRKYVHMFIFLIITLYAYKENVASRRKHNNDHDQAKRTQRKSTSTPDDADRDPAGDNMPEAPCDVTDPDVLSAIRRTHSYKCRQLFMNAACAMRQDNAVTDDAISVGGCPNTDMDSALKSAALQATTDQMPPERLAFIVIASGRSARQLGQLLRVLYRPEHHYVILIHVKDDYLARTLSDMTSHLINIHISVMPYDTHWANPLRMRMIYLTLNQLLRKWSSWQHVVVLEDVDFPVRTVDELARYVARYSGKSFMAVDRADIGFARALGLDHLFIQCDGHTWRVGSRHIPEELQIGMGATRMILSRDLVKYVVFGSDDFINNMRAHWTFAMNPLESFFQTVVLNTKFCEHVIPTSLFVRHMADMATACTCQPQHDHVDWCSCNNTTSTPLYQCCFPYPYKGKDIDELLQSVNTETEQPVFFATKFDSLIGQNAINKIHTKVHGKIDPDCPGFDNYWYNVYDYRDKHHTVGDTAMTYFLAFARMASRTTNPTTKDATHSTRNITRLLQVHTVFTNDVLQGFVVRCEVNITSHVQGHVAFIIEAYLKRLMLPNIRYRLRHSSKLLHRLDDVQVVGSSGIHNVNFDPLGTLLGPHSVIDYVTYWREGSETDNFTTVFYEPTRQMVAVYSISVVQAPQIQHTVRTEHLMTPLRPGWWTVRYYDKPGDFSEPFLVLPLSVHNGKAIIRTAQAKKLHSGPKGGYLKGDFNIPAQLNIGAYKDKAALNSAKTGVELLEWIDELLRGQWTVGSVCHHRNSPEPYWVKSTPCEETSWSSYSRDIKATVA